MNRIICNICGSEYSENEERCPICSYARQGNEKLAESSAEAVRIKVKGGRFSSKNVKKRRKAQEKRLEGDESKSNKALWIAVALLLAAIVLVTAYIAARFIGGHGAHTGGTPAQTTAATAAPTTLPPTVPCEMLVPESSVVELEAAGEQKQLSIVALPAKTTDQIYYATADPEVATVSETGLVTAVGSGQTTVTVSCGTIVQTITVVCWLPEETTAPPETTTPPETTVPPATTVPTEPTETTAPPELTLEMTDVSLFAPGERFTLSAKFAGKYVSRTEVTWTTSDANIAVVENGYVTGVGTGIATITAEYHGKKAHCIVRCRFDEVSWMASATDVTLAVGESFSLTVNKSSGETADVSWTADADGIVSIEGTVITGVAAGEVTLTTSVDDVAFTCVVRVK